MKYGLDTKIGRSQITAMILSAFFAGLVGQFAMGIQDNKSSEPQFMSYAAFHNKSRCDDAAMKSILLNALDDEKAFEKYSFDWYPGMLEPKHFMRIGIGVTYNDRGYDGDLLTLNSSPDQAVASSAGGGRDPEGISSSQNMGASRGGGEGGGGGAGAAESSKKPAVPGPGQDPTEFLKSYGGVLADNLVVRLQERVDTNRLGSVLKHVNSLAALVPEPKKSAEELAASEQGKAGGEDGRSSAGPGRGGDANAPTQVPGGIPMGMGSGGDRSVGKAGPGETNDQAAAGTASGGATGTTASAPVAAKMLTLAPVPAKETYNSVIPGVVCLNEGKRDELMNAAREKDLDLLFIFDIKVQDSRRVFYSTTNLRLFNVNDPTGADKTVVQTKAIRHDYDPNDPEDKSGKNLFETEMDKVFEEFDKLFVANPLPGGLKTEHVENRIDGLIGSLNSTNRLPIAVEVVAFYRKGLLDQPKAAEALDKIFNGGGQLLLTGTPEDRLAFLNKILAETN